MHAVRGDHTTIPTSQGQGLHGIRVLFGAEPCHRAKRAESLTTHSRKSPQRSPTMPAPNSRGILVAARHGEREDYIQRDAGGNWIPTADRPWDPPLSAAGHQQVRELGRRVARTLAKHGLPPVGVVYGSPLLRCCQTAAGAILGLEDEAAKNDSSGSDASTPLQINIEHGIVESLCEKWYRSWALSGADGTWGYCPDKPMVEGGNVWDVDTDALHPKAKVAAHELFLSPAEMEVRLRETCGEAIRSRSTAIVNASYTRSAVPLTDDFCWGTFESRKMQLARARALADTLAARHPNETVLLLSHGSPVTHLFESVSGKDWTVHGVCGYASFSVYQHESAGISDDGGGDKATSSVCWR